MSEQTERFAEELAQRRRVAAKSKRQMVDGIAGLSDLERELGAPVASAEDERGS